jgi:hypothetical protein
MSETPNETACAAKAVVRQRSWTSPSLTELPKLSQLTLASAIGGGGGTGGGGSTVFGILLALLALAGCSTVDRQAPEAATPPVLAGSIACHADVATGTVACDGPQHAISREIIGGQGRMVALRSTNVGYAAGVFSFDVTVQNLTSQTLGWDGTGFVSGFDSVIVFIESGPNVTNGTGAITVANASGTSTFTAGGQAYFNYDSLAPGQTSALRTWEFNVPGSVTTFDFTVQVAARVPDYTGVLRWAPVAEFTNAAGGVLKDIAANSSTDAIAVGSGGRTYRKAGGTWELLPVQVTEDWVAVEAIGGGKYLGATAGTVYLFDRNVWRPLYTPGFPILSLSGTAVDRIIVGGFEQLRWLGTGGWQSAGIGGRTYKWVAALGGDQAVALATQSGQVRLNFNSATVTSTSDGFDHTAFYAGLNGNFGFGAMNGGVPPSYIKDDASGFLYGPKNDTIVDAVDFGAAAAERWAVMRSTTSGVSVLRHRSTGGTWSTVATLPGPVVRMTQDSAGGLYLLFDDGIRRWNGSGVVDELRMTDSLTAIWGDDTLAFVGTASGKVWRYSGGSWADLGAASGSSILSIHGLPGGYAYALDVAGQLLWYDGSTWGLAGTFPGATAMYAFAMNDLAITISAPGLSIVLHGDPAAFANEANPAGVTAAVRAIWGTSSTDFWLVGDGGNIMYYDGSSYAWDQFYSDDLLAIHGDNNSDIWISGKNGVRLHKAGAMWIGWDGGPTVSAIWTPRGDWAYYSLATGQITAYNSSGGAFNDATIPFANGEVRQFSGVSTNSLWALIGNGLYRGMR